MHCELEGAEEGLRLGAALGLADGEPVGTVVAERTVKIEKSVSHKSDTNNGTNAIVKETYVRG